MHDQYNAISPSWTDCILCTVLNLRRLGAN